MLVEITKRRIFVAEEGYPKGTIGVVVSLYSSDSACEAEPI